MAGDCLVFTPKGSANSLSQLDEVMVVRHNSGRLFGRQKTLALRTEKMLAGDIRTTQTRALA